MGEAGGARGGCVGIGDHLALHARLGEAHSTAARAFPPPSASAAHAAAVTAPPGSPSRAAATLRAGTGGTAIAANSDVRRAIGSGVAAGKERDAREAAHLDRNQWQ